MPNSTLTMYDVAVLNGHFQWTLFPRVFVSQAILFAERTHIDYNSSIVWIDQC